MSNKKSTASSLLLRQYRELTDPKKAIPSFNIELDDDSNIFVWNIGVMVLNEDSIYHGGYFKSQMRFPDDYPFSPPQFRFIPAIFHPNVYRDGRLCISILHQSGDPMTDEPDAETWSPVQTVESVLISIVSLLEDPNISSPANVDAAVDYRKNPEQYKARVKMEVERSKQDIPKGFIMPSSNDSAYISSDTTASIRNNNNPSSNDNNNSNDHIQDNFWYDSDLDDDIHSNNNNNNNLISNSSINYNSNSNNNNKHNNKHNNNNSNNNIYNGSNSILYDDDVYNYQGSYGDDSDEDPDIEDDDDDEEDFYDDDISIDNDSVMDRKQPHKNNDNEEIIEDDENVGKIGKK